MLINTNITNKKYILYIIIFYYTVYTLLFQWIAEEIFEHIFHLKFSRRYWYFCSYVCIKNIFNVSHQINNYESVKNILNISHHVKSYEASRMLLLYDTGHMNVIRPLMSLKWLFIGSLFSYLHYHLSYIMLYYYSMGSIGSEAPPFHIP